MLLKSYSLVIFTYTICASAAVYNWDVTWVLINPDGLLTRSVIGINGQWPPPAIHANVGEQITVVLTNQLGNETTGMHFHGFFQEGTNFMDGPTVPDWAWRNIYIHHYGTLNSKMPFLDTELLTISHRSTNMAPIGITRTTEASTPMVSADQS